MVELISISEPDLRRKLNLPFYPEALNSLLMISPASFHFSETFGDLVPLLCLPNPGTVASNNLTLIRVCEFSFVFQVWNLQAQFFTIIQSLINASFQSKELLHSSKSQHRMQRPEQVCLSGQSGCTGLSHCTGLHSKKGPMLILRLCYSHVKCLSHF